MILYDAWLVHLVWTFPAVFVSWPKSKMTNNHSEVKAKWPWKVIHVQYAFDCFPEWIAWWVLHWLTSQLLQNASQMYIISIVGLNSLSEAERYISGVFTKLALYFSTLTFHTQCSPYFILCCKYVYNCNSTEARWFFTKIGNEFCQNIPTGKNNTTVLRK